MTLARPLNDKFDPPLAVRRNDDEQGHKPVSAPRIYRGRRNGFDFGPSIEVFVGTERPRMLDPRLDLLALSDELEWLDESRSSYQVALAILADCLGNRRIALSFYRDFRADVVSELDSHAWDLTAAQVHDWLVRKTIASLELTLPPARRRRRMLLD